MFTAATQMRLKGLDCDPQVSRFLIAALHSAASTPPAAEREAWHGWHVTPLVARLLYERPDVTADDMRASQTLRGAIVDAFRQPHGEVAARLTRFVLLQDFPEEGRRGGAKRESNHSPSR